MVYTRTETSERKQFAADVLKGLQKNPKKLSSKYFYDGTGSLLFQKIMELPEYYLTRAETEIFQTQRQEIIYSLHNTQENYNVIDLGAGDAAKTKILLGEMLRQGLNLKYFPVDISEDALNQLAVALAGELPDLKVKSIASEYFSALDYLQNQKPAPKLVLFLGSNIGNFEPKNIRLFTSKLRHYLVPGDQVLIGFDLQKEPHLIRQAYDDAAGITAAFNFNLLHRINQEFNGNFNSDHFKHFAEYNPVSGDMKSYLISTQAQKVFLADLQEEFTFLAWEPIHTETSHKFNLPEIHLLAKNNGLKISQVFTDAKHYFADVLFDVV